MASSSRETPINQQHISGLIVTDGARLFAGTNTTTHVYNGPVTLQQRATKTRQPEQQTPSYYEIPNRKVDGFVGREGILQKIDEALFDVTGPRYAVLQGMGGQGKSQVALEYCHRKKNNPYSAIFWVDATSQDRVERSFHSISERIKKQTDYLPDINARVAVVLKMFTSWTVPWLMVFDNYDSPDTFPNIRDFIPHSELGAILVTSRHPDSNALVINQSSHFIELFGLEEDAAVALLIQQSQSSEGITEDAKKIVERLVWHPLAITQAGAYSRKRKLKFCEFIDHYKRRKKAILENTPQLSQYRKRLGNAEEETSLNVFTTWELSFQQLQSEASKSDVETKLLTLLAFFDEKDISEQLFAGFNDNRAQSSESAKLLIWLNAFSSTGGQWNSDSFEDVMIRLRDSSLLQAFVRGLDGFYHASIHPLVKDWIRLRTDILISQEYSYMAAALVKKILLDSWQKEEFDVPLLTKQNIPLHIIALEESYQEFFISQPYPPPNQKFFNEYSASQLWFAKFLSAIGSHHLAVIINRRLYVHNERALGLEHPDTLTSMVHLASAFWKQGWWKEAEELEVKVMETRKKQVLGLEHPSTLSRIGNFASKFWNRGCRKGAEELEVQVEGMNTSMANLALTFCSQGRWKEAEELGVQVVETRRRVLGLEHPSTLISMSILAIAFWNQGQWKKAEELFEQIIETSSSLLGLEHPDTLTGKANLASTYRNQGRCKEAEELEVQVMETRKRVLGLEHPDTLKIMGNLASTYRNQGQLMEAEELEVQVMETGKKVLGLDHPDTLTSMSNLAMTFGNQGRLNEAEELEVQVMEIRKRVLGVEHPDTLTSMSNLAVTLGDQGRLNEAEELEVQVMETSLRVLGVDHPDTLTSIGNFASTYRNQGQVKEAEELEVHVMEMRKKVLGPEHPDTLTSMANLAHSFWIQDLKSEAIQLMSEVVESRQKKIGSDHPDTIKSIDKSHEWQDER